MPELPEVEIIVRRLREVLGGRTIIRAQLVRQGLAPQVSSLAFARNLKGARVDDVSRRGKNILIRFDNGRTLVTHLRMTGQFLLVDREAHPVAHTHAIFSLDNRMKLLFTDQRHFGWMTIVKTAQESATQSLSKLGAEPLEGEFTVESLHATLRRSGRAIKLFLLDQTKVAGLGNIYVVEALFRAGISPQARARTISRPKALRLRNAIVDVLTEAIGKGSTPYVSGEFESWHVYDREGEPCSVCLTPIKRTRQGQRSTYYCPRCQRR
jgi:formamidopyrimidine-DNA glycosylase